ncbi:Uncharacterized protein FWK35_00032088, partial [Aphis craccivora]
MSTDQYLVYTDIPSHTNHPLKSYAVYDQRYSREEITSSDIIKKNIVSSNIINQQQPIITKREIQDYFKPAEQIYDYDEQLIKYTKLIDEIRMVTSAAQIIVRHIECKHQFDHKLNID